MGDFKASLESCPYVYQAQNCTSGDYSHVKTDSALAWVNTCSCVASVVGSVLMLIWYRCNPNVRTGFRKLSTWLAAYNILLACGSLLGSLNFLIYDYQSPNATVNGSLACQAFAVVCFIQGFVTLFSTLSTLIWNAVLGAYLYLRFRKGATFATRWSMWLLYHMVPVLLPLLAVILLTAVGCLGYSPYSSASGCIITAAFRSVNVSTMQRFTPTYVGVVSFVKVFELITCFLMVFFFCFTLKHIWASLLDETISRTWKMLIVPFFFVFLRLWGTIVFFLSISLYYTNNIDHSAGCVTKPVHGILYSLRILQAVGDPGQGWANTLIFLFISSSTQGGLLNCKKRKEVPRQRKYSLDEEELEKGVSTLMSSSHGFASCRSSVTSSDGFSLLDSFRSESRPSFYSAFGSSD